MFPYTFPGLALSNLFYLVNCAIFVPCSSTLIILEVLFCTLFALELKFDSAGGRYDRVKRKKFQAIEQTLRMTFLHHRNNFY